MPLRVCFSEENDHDFIRWCGNLLRGFLDDGRIAIVGQREAPELMLASVWRRHRAERGLPVVLVSNENWKLFPAPLPLSRYHAVVGLLPPGDPCPFIEFPYAAVHFDATVDELHALREELLQVRKTRFCCFVVSNDMGDLAADRVALFDRIHRWKAVDSAGRLCNNTGYRAPRGMAFLRWIAQYQYMICLENSRTPGYLTEKPFQAWIAGTVPIYDGGCLPRLNPGALVGARDPEQALRELAVLADDAAAYESRRRADLLPARLDLAPFEQRFQAHVIEPLVARRPSRAAVGDRARWWRPHWWSHGERDHPDRSRGFG